MSASTSGDENREPTRETKLHRENRRIGNVVYGIFISAILLFVLIVVFWPRGRPTDTSVPKAIATQPAAQPVSTRSPDPEPPPSPSDKAPPLPKKGEKDSAKKHCPNGVHIEPFSTEAMSSTQYQELVDYLRNAKCARRPQPEWLRQKSTWSYGKHIPKRGSFTMNGTTIEFWEITRPSTP